MTPINCEWVRNYLPLFLYDELSFEEEEAIEAHAVTCGDCRAALDTERRLHAAFGSNDSTLPAGLLNGCRDRLAVQLTAEPAVGMSGRVRRWFQSIRWSPDLVLRPLGGLALIAVGFFGARLLPPQDQPNAASPFVTSVAEPVATRVRRVEPSGAGRFQIVLDETRQRIVSGSPDDDQIRQLLISAASDPSDPGLRGEMIEILGSVAPSDQTRQALLHALEDSNDGIRLRALQGLRPMAHQSDVRRELARVLVNDSNQGMRTQAIDLLTDNQPGNALRENEMIGVFQDLMGHEQNHYVRMRVERQLQRVKASTEVY